MLRYAIVANNFVISTGSPGRSAKFLQTEKIFFSQKHREIIIFNIFLIRENSWTFFLIAALGCANN